jgi:FMN phosphatase YigB (HAD superfamily)
VVHLERTFSFLRFFPAAARTYSCHVKVSKPDPAIFRAALSSVKANAE